jgi:hypothetical protein
LGADVDVEEKDGSDPGECIEAEGSRVVDPHRFNVDPDPAFLLILDPDPDAVRIQFRIQGLMTKN